MDIKLNKRSLNSLLIVTLILCVLTIGLFVFVINNTGSKEPIVVVDNCLPAFRDGGGPYYLANSPFRENLAPDSNNGKRLVVEGYILDTNCSHTISNAILDIWQASEEGEYEDEFYRGQLRTNDDGYYKFETVVPLGYGEGTAYRPPHIHFKVHYDGKEIVTSQMFFEDVRGMEGFEDEYIIELDSEGSVYYGSHNIVLPDFNL